MNLGARHNPNTAPGGGQRLRLAASGYGAPVIVFLICVAVLAMAYNHTRGNFHRLRTAVMQTQPASLTVPSGPGGQNLIELARSATSVGSYPQFLSVTLAPGRGMDMLQIVANIPGRGDTPLLFSPKPEVVSQLLAEQAPALRDGTGFGAALLAPWAGHLAGTPTETSDLLHSIWQGHWNAFPSESSGSSRSVEGLLLGVGSDNIRTGLVPDGESAEALFHAGSFGGSWPSSLDIKTHIDLTGQAIELTMIATNVGQAPVPVGLGWRPIFRIVSGDRSQASLVVPSSNQVLTDPHTSLPNGKLESVTGTSLDFEHAGGTALSTRSLDVSYDGLRRGAIADGPIIELRDTSADYGVRLIPLTDNISALHVTAPANQPWVALELATNQSDPLGRQWNPNPDSSGIKVLDPGQSLTFRVRLEIFALTRSTAPLLP